MSDKDYNQKVKLLELRIKELELLLAIETKYPKVYYHPYPIYIQTQPIYVQSQPYYYNGNSLNVYPCNNSVTLLGQASTTAAGSAQTIGVISGTNSTSLNG